MGQIAGALQLMLAAVLACETVLGLGWFRRRRHAGVVRRSLGLDGAMLASFFIVAAAGVALAGGQLLLSATFLLEGGLQYIHSKVGIRVTENGILTFRRFVPWEKFKAIELREDDGGTTFSGRLMHRSWNPLSPDFLRGRLEFTELVAERLPSEELLADMMSDNGMPLGASGWRLELAPSSSSTSASAAKVEYVPTEVEQDVIELCSNERGNLLGRITESQLQFLVEHLEELSARVYYLDIATADFLQQEGADPPLLDILRRAINAGPGIEVR